MEVKLPGWVRLYQLKPPNLQHFQIKRLAPVDGGETGAIDDHIACGCDKVAVVLGIRQGKLR
jgi:hypothetical protein